MLRLSVFFVCFFISILVHSQTIIDLKKENGVFTVPCKVNDLKLKFIFDTGASGVSLSSTEAVFMLKNDYLAEGDLLGNIKFQIANGEIIEGTKVILRKIEIGNLVLENIEASIVHTISAPLLLGQSVLEKLGKIEIDYEKNQLIINPNLTFVKIKETPSNDINTSIELPVFVEKKSISADSIIRLTKNAEGGDLESMVKLGGNYEYGIGVKMDYLKAKYWYEKAAVLGDSDAMYYLGWLYINGDGVEKDIEKAKYWFEKAVALGNTNGMTGLGALYRDGDGKSNEKTKYWFEKAANLGDEYAMYYLGSLYQDEYGIEKDDKKAKYWFEKITDADIMNSIGVDYVLAKDYEKAKYWYEKASVLGNSVAMSNLGGLYENGDGVEKDFEMAKYWYEKAAVLGNYDAMSNLGGLYENGDWVEKDFEMAKYWYEKLVALGKAEGLVYLGDLYKNADGEEKNYEKAKYWYEKAVELGSKLAMFGLSEIYYYENNYYESIKWFKKSTITSISGINEYKIESINPENINGISLEKRKALVKELSYEDYSNGWIYLHEDIYYITFFKDVKTEGYSSTIKFWIKTIPQVNELSNFRNYESESFNSTTIKQKIASNLRYYVSNYRINCGENEINNISNYYFGANGNFIYSDNSNLSFSAVVPGTVGEIYLKTICEYYEKFGK